MLLALIGPVSYTHLVLCQLNELIQEIFKMSGFNKIVAIAATRADALAKLDRTAGPANPKPLASIILRSRLSAPAS